MIRSGKTWLATALAASCFMSTLAMAATTPTVLGSLSSGSYTVALPPDAAKTTFFNQQITFALAQDSVLTASVTNASWAAGTLSIGFFNEATGLFELQPVVSNILLTDSPISLGALAATLPATSARSYVLDLTGAVTSASLPVGGQLTLSVQAVPEPGTWVLMGLGLAGVAAVTRRPRAAH
jgi:hypothetical protein